MTGYHSHRTGRRHTILCVIGAMTLARSVMDGAAEVPAAGPSYSPDSSGSEVLASVDGEVFTARDLRRSMRTYWDASLRRPPTPEDVRRVEEVILNSFVDRVLVVNAGRRMEPPMVSTAELEEEYARRLKLEFKDEPGLLSAWLNKNDLSEARYRAEIEADLAATRLRELLGRSIPSIPLAEAESYYAAHLEQFNRPAAVHLGTIRLRASDGASATAVAERAEFIVSEISRGVDFGELALEFSNDSRKQSGGDWGWIAQRDLAEELSVVAFALPVGESSGPVSLGNDLFILRVIAKRDAGIAPFIEVRDRIVQMLESQATRDARRSLLEELRRNARIERFTPDGGTMLRYPQLQQIRFVPP